MCFLCLKWEKILNLMREGDKKTFNKKMFYLFLEKVNEDDEMINLWPKKQATKTSLDKWFLISRNK